MKFVQQRCWVRTTMDYQRIPVMVGVGSGLGYARIPWLHLPGYHLIHVNSGWFLCRGLETAPQARQWITRLRPLTDWTQDEQVIRRLPQSLILQVAYLRDAVGAKEK